MGDRDYSYLGWSKAFALFAKYDTSPYVEVAAEHDIIFAGPNPKDVSEEDKQELTRYGWRVNEEFDCFSHNT